MDLTLEDPSASSRRRGRKRDSSEPSSHKQMLSREAQRKWRDKRQNHIDTLEKQVVEFRDLLKSKNTETALLRAANAQLACDLEAARREIKLIRGDVVSPGYEGPAEKCLNFNCAMQLARAEFAGMKKVPMGSKDNDLSIKIDAKCVQLEEKVLALTQEIDTFKTLFGTALYASAIAGTHSGRKAVAEIVLESHRSRENTTETPKEDAFDFESSVPSVASMDEWMDESSLQSSPHTTVRTAVELYGPVRDQVARYCLKSIAPFKDGKVVDALFSTICSLTKTVDRHRMKKLYIKYINGWNDMMDAASSVDDRNQAIEITLAFHDLNRKQIDHLLSILFDSPETVSKRVLRRASMSKLKPEAIKAIDGLKAIPSLKSVGNIIDDLCLQFEGDNQMTAEELIHKLKLVRMLQSMCVTYEDRKKAQTSILPPSPSPVVVVPPSSAVVNPTSRQTVNQINTSQSAIIPPTTVRAPLPSTTAVSAAVSSANVNTNGDANSARSTVNTIRTDLTPTFSQQSQQDDTLPNDGSAGGGTARPPATSTRTSARTTAPSTRLSVTASTDFWGRFSGLGGEVDPLIDNPLSATGTASATGTLSSSVSQATSSTSTSTGKSTTKSVGSVTTGGAYTATGSSGALNAQASGGSVVAPILGAFGGAIAVGLVAMLIMWIIGRHKKKTNNKGPGNYPEIKPTTVLPNTNAEPAATEPFLQAGVAEPGSDIA
ncbi:hypothetical protein HDU81_009826 [Chytriomyces hyalinus]|nr:hypothetical protein HDU81_009826 [Chytriomyces hyalinus]